MKRRFPIFTERLKTICIGFISHIAPTKYGRRGIKPRRLILV